MKNQLAKNIGIYRKEKGFTQRELAQVLGVTFQAVSKWENAQTMPDIMILPHLSRVLEVSIDKLLGYVYQDKQISFMKKNTKRRITIGELNHLKCVIKYLKKYRPLRR